MRVVQTLQRGLAVLDFLAEAGEPVRTSDVAEHFAIDKANASRLLRTLHESGWARRTDGRRYVVADRLNNDGGKPLESLLALREVAAGAARRPPRWFAGAASLYCARQGVSRLRQPRYPE
jgi:DNA-binding IclR family transcriptional regulator